MISASITEAAIKAVSAFSKKNQEQYNTMLYGISILNFVSRSYILASCSSYNTAYRLLNKAIELKHIKEFSVTQKIDSRQKKLVYYGITGNGLKYLSECQNELLPHQQWMGKMRVTTSRVRLKNQTLKTERMSRYMSVTGAAYLMSLLGLDVAPINLSNIRMDYDETTDAGDSTAPHAAWWAGTGDFFSENTDAGTQTLEGIIRDAKQEYERLEQTNNGPCETQDIIFKNAFEVKQTLARKTGQYSDFHAGRYTGIAESPFKSVLMYAGNKTGMAWSDRASKPEFSAHHAYASHFSKFNSLKAGENHGVMFVENAKMFADLILDRKGKRKGEDFASKFNSFVIFPLDNIGASQFEEYMTSDSKEYEHFIVKSAIESGIFRENKDGYIDLFPIVNEQGTPMTIGVFMDIVKMNRIARISAKTNIPFGILCYPWQIDFYQRVYPEANYMTFE